jgi:hypothetical protein
VNGPAYSIIVAFLLYAAVLARIRPLSPRRRALVSFAVIANTLLLWWLSQARTGAGIVIRDWMPAAQILIAYWISGAFVGPPMGGAEAWLAKWDRWLFDGAGLSRAIARAPRVVLEVLEAAYLSVYVVVPLGFAIVWFVAIDLDVHRYWNVVVASELICYAMLPWIRTRPPRAVGDHPVIDSRRVMLRRMNLLVLQRGSIQANTVPSGHAAGAMATALMVMEYLPGVGLALMGLAFAIMAGSIAGRYHYLMDSVLGALVAIAAWGIWRA